MQCPLHLGHCAKGSRYRDEEARGGSILQELLVQQVYRERLTVMYINVVLALCVTIAAF